MPLQPPSRPRAGSKAEHTPDEGFVLIAVLFLVALIVIGLAVAAPQVAKSIQRDKELELVHRGEQYKRAIKLYYRKFGSYPNTIDQLVNTNQIRFLRKRYTDPMTGKDDWKLVYFGQAHVQPMGLFGQTLGVGGAAGIAGASPIAGSATGAAGAQGGAFGASSGSSFGSSSGSSFGSSSGSSFGSGSSGGSFGSGSSGSSFGGSSGSTGTTDGSNNGGSFGSSSGFGTSGSTTNGTGTISGTSGAFGSSGSTGSTLSGGGPIVGVVIPDTHASMREYKKQKHYNEWEFVYNPIEEQMQGGGLAGAGQQNLNGSGTTGNGFNSGSPTPGFGSNGLSGSQMNGGQSTGSGSTTPQPQQ